MQNVVSLKEKNSYLEAMEQLIAVVQELSHARHLSEVTAIVRKAARDLTGADGATFILRDGDQCYYADENAISPLWKGQRFPMKNCVSGWAMLHEESVIIEDIYTDDRVPVEAYRPTFVKSMLMVPIRQKNPIGAIGNYWASQHRATPEEIHILQALANVTAVAIENVRLNGELEKKIGDLEDTNSALSNFVWIAAHDLKAPLRAIKDISGWIEESLSHKQYTEAKDHVVLLRGRIDRMQRLLGDILDYAQLEYITDPFEMTLIGGDALMENVLDLLQPPAGFDIQINPNFKKLSLPRMPLQQVFLNLIGNAISHHDKMEGAVITVDCEKRDHDYVFTISDNGPGIDTADQEKIFQVFHVMKTRDINGGSGLGLALVKKILDLYGGSVGVKSVIGRGSVFTVTWPVDLGRT